MSTFINEASWDRALRIVLGVAMLVLGWFGIVTGGWGLALKILGFLPLITGIVGWCPAYSLFGVSTCPVSPSGPPSPRPVA